MIACPQCATDLPDEARFCLTCGAPLTAPAAIAEERKTVTTLFCDLVAFTAMSEAADPEDVDAVLRRYHAVARKVIESHGGSVEKFIGDAVVGVFGVPAVHEDDPERAVRAGLRIVAALEGLTRPDGSPLEVRVGVNTGEALVRLDVTPGSGEGFLTGDAVNTAARLQAAAPAGGVVVGALTHALAGDALEFLELEPLALRGKREPVHAWLAVRARRRTGLRTSGRSATPFFGRESELAALHEALDAATATGSARFRLIVGEPGIGKSRLVLEFARALEAQPGFVTWRQGRCLPYGEGVTFWALGEIVKEHAGIVDPDDAGVVESKLDAVLPAGEEGAWLRQRLRPLLGLRASQATREESFAAWRLFLEHIASSEPTVIVVEDLHWAGEPMLAFIEHLVSLGLEVPLLLVATARPEIMRLHDGALTAADGGGGGDGEAGDRRLRRLTLPVLSPDQAAAVIAALLEDELAADVGERVVRLVGGNPLYAEQYVRLLLDEGLLVPAPGGLHLRADADLPLPETVQAVLAARLDTLPAEHKALLCNAAVIGETFWRGGVAALSGRGAAVVDRVMAALVDRDLVRPVVNPSMEGETEYLFWHALARDVAYAQLPRKVRARKHQAAALWIEQAGGQRADEFAEIAAHHCLAALDLARATGDEEFAASLVAPAVNALGRAGRRALHLDVAAAERHLARAVELAGPDSEERLRLLPKWGEALLLRNRYREAAAAFEEAIAGFEARGDSRATASAMCWLAQVLPWMNEPAGAVIRAAVELLADDDPCPEQAEVFGPYALTLLLEDGDPREVVAAADRAIEVCGLLGLPEPALALSSRGMARINLGELGGFEDYKRALADARKQGLGIERATILVNYPGLVQAVSGARAGRDALLEALQFAGRHGLDAYVDTCRVGLIQISFDMGEWDEALVQAADMLPAVEEAGDLWDVLYLRSLQSFIWAYRGEPSEAASFVGWLAETGRDNEIGWTRLFALLAASSLRFHLGETGAAQELLVEAVATSGNAITSLDLFPGAVRTALACQDGELAERLAQKAESCLPEQVLPGHKPSVVSLWALLAEARGDHEAAAASFADAAARWHEFGVPYEYAHALLGQGRCLVALGRAPEAAAPLAAAREIFARLGARPALEETDQWLRRLL